MLASIDDIVATAGARSVLISAIPPDDGFAADALEYNLVLVEHAADRGWAFVDPWADMRVDGVWADGLSPDGIHPTADAAEIAGKIISGAIRQLVPEAPGRFEAMSDAPTAPVLEHWKRNVTLFLTGQTVSLFGSMIVQYAVMWYVTIETKSGLAIALYAVAAFLPQGIVSIFGGVLADRVNRRILVMTADAVIAAATLVLALLMLNGITDLWIIVLAVGIRSLGAGFQTPAVSAMIPQLTPPDQLMRVNGIFGTISSAMMLIAPAVAGVVFGVFGIVPVFFIDVVTAVIGIGFLALVSVPTLAAVAAKTTSYREDLVEGIRFIWHDRVVRWLLVIFAIIFVLVVAPSFVTPLMIARTFGGEVWQLDGARARVQHRDAARRGRGVDVPGEAQQDRADPHRDLRLRRVDDRPRPQPQPDRVLRASCSWSGCSCRCSRRPS